MMKRESKIKYRTWFATPDIGAALHGAAGTVHDLYRALCARGRGLVAIVTISNVDLMKLAGLSDPKRFREAREELETRGLIRCHKEDTLGRLYAYEILDEPDPPETADDHHVADDMKLVPIPQEVLHSVLSRQPDLNGRKKAKTRRNVRRVKTPVVEGSKHPS
jgi:hypothetical protein